MSSCSKSFLLKIYEKVKWIWLLWLFFNSKTWTFKWTLIKNKKKQINFMIHWKWKVSFPLGAFWWSAVFMIISGNCEIKLWLVPGVLFWPTIDHPSLMAVHSWHIVNVLTSELKILSLMSDKFKQKTLYYILLALKVYSLLATPWLFDHWTLQTFEFGFNFNCRLKHLTIRLNVSG